MTWTLHVNGHAENEEDERTVLEKVREALAEVLPSTLNASFSGMHCGSVDLKPEPDPEPTAEAEAEEAPSS